MSHARVIIAVLAMAGGALVAHAFFSPPSPGQLPAAQDNSLVALSGTLMSIEGRTFVFQTRDRYATGTIDVLVYIDEETDAYLAGARLSPLPSALEPHVQKHARLYARRENGIFVAKRLVFTLQ